MIAGQDGRNQKGFMARIFLIDVDVVIQKPEADIRIAALDAVENRRFTGVVGNINGDALIGDSLGGIQIPLADGALKIVSGKGIAFLFRAGPAQGVIVDRGHGRIGACQGDDADQGSGHQAGYQAGHQAIHKAPDKTTHDTQRDGKRGDGTPR